MRACAYYSIALWLTLVRHQACTQNSPHRCYNDSIVFAVERETDPLCNNALLCCAAAQQCIITLLR